MSLAIRYLAPAAAGTAFTYSVERCGDGWFFDFESCLFCPNVAVTPGAVIRPMLYHDGVATANFDYCEKGTIYLIAVQIVGRKGKPADTLAVLAMNDGGRDGRIVVEQPVPAHDDNLPRCYRCGNVRSIYGRLCSICAHGHSCECLGCDWLRGRQYSYR